MKSKDYIQFTARIPSDLHGRLRYIAADKNESMNETIIQLLQEATEGYHIAVPSGLLSHEQPQ